MVGLLSDQIQMYFGNMVDLVEQVRSQKVRLLAVSGERRSAQFPDIPTVSEQLHDFVFTSWVGYFAPTDTPAGIVERLSKALSEVCRDKDVIHLVARMEVECVGGTPAALAATIQADLPIAKAAVEAAGVGVK
jgi:tripartite-type tricarboxylate transporter receptor subunit TctC